MINSRLNVWDKHLFATMVLATLVGLGGCATTGPAGSEFDDPYESVNRKVHDFNKGVDTVLYRPASQVYGTVLPDAVRQKVTNFSTNWDIPSDVMNDLLQARGEDTVHNIFRFMINTTLGVVGIFDPATSFGLEERDTDFGETLHVWGTGEGAYLAVPFLGPSTQRDLTGWAVDFVSSPVSAFLTPEQVLIRRVAFVAEYAGDRYDFSDSIDTILYDSADSYAQSRVIYLENRRFELGDSSEETYVDPYEELYGE